MVEYSSQRKRFQNTFLLQEIYTHSIFKIIPACNGISRKISGVLESWPTRNWFFQQKKNGQNGLMVPNFIGICSVLFDIERRLTDGAQLPLHLLWCTRSPNAHYSKLLIRTSCFNIFSYLSTVRLNLLRRDNFGGSFSIRYTSPLIAGEITHKVWGFSLIMTNTIHLEVKYIYSALLGILLLHR